MRRRWDHDAARIIAATLVGMAALAVLLPVFTCLLCSSYGPNEDGCSNCGGDGRASLHVNWTFASWLTGSWFAWPF